MHIFSMISREGPVQVKIFHILCYKYKINLFTINYAQVVNSLPPVIVEKFLFSVTCMARQCSPHLYSVSRIANNIARIEPNKHHANDTFFGLFSYKSYKRFLGSVYGASLKLS